MSQRKQELYVENVKYYVSVIQFNLFLYACMYVRIYFAIQKMFQIQVKIIGVLETSH